ncbi:sulfite exporter TauE/SafE family protein [Pseudooctadecabacter jejudonensis]|uniref:Probable membrane transporter protein n=1 Tax=Pseudooctadecabacter jejudonensis TaxID=1391910 RepID=A0A1Y5RVH5_9RHOB|nr:sulfite exporter TauE/SafE family protein [Pseudooctadecabacter jejudonensis]SLN26503.1 Sulfite exporter TauE/SafE [Pseudooctadecabacter jejudonensis]
MDGSTFWILALVAAFCVGLSKGGAPAFGALAVPILSLTISPLVAAGLLLPVFVFSDVFGIWTYRKYIHLGVLKVAVFGILVGTAVGWATASIVTEDHVRVLIGVIGLAFSLNYILRSKPGDAARPITWGRGLLWTSVAGFTSFVSHSGAPPWQVWTLPLKLPKMVFAGTSTAGFAIMNALKIIPYWHLGQLQLQSLWITAVLFLPALGGVWVAYRLIKVLPDRVFYAVVTWMLLAVSIKLIWDGLGGLWA